MWKWIFSVFVVSLALVGCASPPAQEENILGMVPLSETLSLHPYQLSWKNEKAILSNHQQRVIIQPGNPFVSINGSLKEFQPAPSLREKEIWISSQLQQTLNQLPAVPKETSSVAVSPASSISEYIEPIPPLKTQPKTPEISAQKEFLVVIDPGHGGKDPGGLSRTGKLNEKELTLMISNRVADDLSTRGIKVVFTRTEDRFIPLPERVKDLQSAHCFVSIHINSNENTQCAGYEIIYQTMDHHSESLRRQSKFLANQVLSGLKKYVPNARSRGLKKNVRCLHVLKNSKIPAVLLELGFISNPEEEILLNDAEYQKKLAKAIADGVVQSLPSLKI